MTKVKLLSDRCFSHSSDFAVRGEWPCTLTMWTVKKTGGQRLSRELRKSKQ
jgi:hypothetical protein